MICLLCSEQFGGALALEVYLGGSKHTFEGKQKQEVSSEVQPCDLNHGKKPGAEGETNPHRE